MRDLQVAAKDYLAAALDPFTPNVTIYYPDIAAQAAFPFAQVRRDYSTTAHPTLGAGKIGTMYLVLASRGFSSSQHETLIEPARSLEGFKLWDSGSIEYARVSSITELTEKDPNLEGVIRSVFTALVDPLIYKSLLG